jgi:anaerobic magnesium-protoporphyrin IX monomethyl ester cyclase
MNILILDPYRKADYRISKDTNGGYGTANNFGKDLIPRILKYLLKKNSDYPSLQVAYTYSVLNDSGHNVDYDKNLPKNLDNYDLFIIVSSIVCCETELEYIKFLKTKKKKVFVIGPFATSNSKIYVDAGGSVILGESEFYFLSNKNFLKDLDQDVISFNHELELDDLPFPKWDLMIKNFNGVDKLYGNLKSVTILATRGCPYSCFHYCVYPLSQGRKVRQRTPENIVKEMRYWVEKHNVKMFIFRDPVFSINRKHTVELCELIIKEKLNIRFAIETHLRILDSELLDLLVKSGLKATIVGVESANQEVLKNSNRYTIKKDEQLIKIRELESKNIQVSSMFILGFPHDNFETMNETINYAKQLNTTYSLFNIWTPYPGTPVYNSFKDKIVKTNYESFDMNTLVFKHQNLTEKNISNYLSKAYTKYYFRIGWLIKYLKSFYQLNKIS